MKICEDTGQEITIEQDRVYDIVSKNGSINAFNVNTKELGTHRLRIGKGKYIVTLNPDLCTTQSVNDTIDNDRVLQKLSITVTWWKINTPKSN